MAINLSDNIRVGQQKPVEAKYLNGLTPYVDITEALSLIPVTQRHQGLTININGIEYWWIPSDADLDKDPIVKEQGGGGTVEFADIEGNPRDNTALDTELTTLETTFNTGLTELSEDLQDHENRVDNPHNVTKSQVGLGMVDNTSDLDKPISTATQAALDTKLNSANKATVSDLNTGTDNDKYATSQSLQGSKYLDQSFSKLTATTTGTNTAYVATLTPAITTLVDKQIFVVKFHLASGASPTLNINGLGAKAIRFFDDSVIGAGGVPINFIGILMYDSAVDRFKIAGSMPPTFYDTRYILNTTSQQAASYYINGTGRIDSGLALGTAINAAAFLTIVAATAAKAQFLLTQGTVDYTGTTNGMFWNNGGELKFIDNTIVNRLFKVYNNELFKSDGLYFLTTNQYGDSSANIKAVEGWVYNTDVISAINGATFSKYGEATITPTTGELKQGQRYYNSTQHIVYEGYDKNKVRIATPGIIVDSANVKWRILVSTGGVVSTELV